MEAVQVMRRGGAIEVATERGEVVEAELNRLIEKRTHREPTPDELEPSYAESVRRHNTKIRRQNRALWYGWHMDQAERHRRNLEDLIAHHEQQAARLCEEGAA